LKADTTVFKSASISIRPQVRRRASKFANDANNIRNMAFLSAQELFLGEVDKIAKEIGEMEPGDMALKKIFKITSQALSFLGFISGQVSRISTRPTICPPSVATLTRRPMKERGRWTRQLDGRGL
jgi:hypothetical protein